MSKVTRLVVVMVVVNLTTLSFIQVVQDVPFILSLITAFLSYVPEFPVTATVLRYTVKGTCCLVALGCRMIDYGFGRKRGGDCMKGQNRHTTYVTL